MNRRKFVRSAVLSGLVAGCTDDTSGKKWLMPEEGEPHARTWMAFVADERVWGRDLAPRVAATS